MTHLSRPPVPHLLSLFRQTLRSLSRTPGYGLAACLTLAVGLAAALGAFAPAWDLLGMPFDFRNPSQVVCLSGEGREGASFLRPLSVPDFWDLQRELKTVQGLAACRDDSIQRDSPDGPEQVRTARVSPEFFQVMGLSLLLGRDFEAKESKGGEHQDAYACSEVPTVDADTELIQEDLRSGRSL